jgi:hypothetical protein
MNFRVYKKARETFLGSWPNANFVSVVLDLELMNIYVYDRQPDAKACRCSCGYLAYVIRIVVYKENQYHTKGTLHM